MMKYEFQVRMQQRHLKAIGQDARCPSGSRQRTRCSLCGVSPSENRASWAKGHEISLNPCLGHGFRLISVF